MFWLFWSISAAFSAHDCRVVSDSAEPTQSQYPCLKDFEIDLKGKVLMRDELNKN